MTAQRCDRYYCSFIRIKQEKFIHSQSSNVSTSLGGRRLFFTLTFRVSSHVQLATTRNGEKEIHF